MMAFVPLDQMVDAQERQEAANARFSAQRRTDFAGAEMLRLKVGSKYGYSTGVTFVFTPEEGYALMKLLQRWWDEGREWPWDKAMSLEGEKA